MTTPSPGAADLISRLNDDVLQLLPGPRDLVRTGAVSQRWRSLWTRVPTLRFSFNSCREFRVASDADRYVAFVDGFLSHRAAQTEPATIEDLSIFLDTSRMRGPEEERVVSSSIRAAQGWIRHAAQHAVKSFRFELHLPWGYSNDNVLQQQVIVLDELPSSAKLETMHLALSSARVQLPSAAVFASLTDLSLECMVVASGSGSLLARLLSSACCPRLQKLRLRNLTGLKELLLEAGALRELSWEEMERGCSLELRTPSLRVLHMLGCYDNRLDMLTISAPKLEELMFLKEQPDRIIVHGELPFVEKLKVDLSSHGCSRDDHKNDVSIRLLQCCTSVRYLDVSLQVMQRQNQVVNTISGRMPHLPHVTSLTVHVHLSKLHSFGHGLEDILKQCRNLKYLRVHCPVSRGLLQCKGLQSYILCNHPNHWKSHEISLSHLEEVNFTGLAGIHCELWFIQFLLTSATQLQKLSLSFDREYMEKNTKGGIALIPLLDGGMWTTCRGAYMTYQWKPCISGERACLESITT